MTRSKNIPIGRIDLYGDFSYVDVDENYVDLILESFADPRSNPRGIVVEVAKEQPDRKRGEKKDFGERKERREKRDDFREKRDRRDDDFFEKKSKKKKKDFDDDKPFYKSERSRDGREWLDPDWKEHMDDIDVFFDDNDRPSRKERNAERGFGSSRGSGRSSSRGGGSSRGGYSSSRGGGRGSRGGSRYDDDFYSPKRRGGGGRRR